MKKSFCLLFTLTLLLSVSCCTEQKAENDEILAKINDYELTNEEFEFLLVSDLDFDPDFKLTKEARELFLGRLRRKAMSRVPLRLSTFYRSLFALFARFRPIK